MRTCSLLLALALLGCGSSEDPTSTSTSTGGDTSSSSSTGDAPRGDAGECDYPLTGGLDLVISSVSDNANVETRHLEIDPAPVKALYGKQSCTKGCTDITAGCGLGESKMKTCANLVISIAGQPSPGKTYTIIPAKKGSDEDGNPGLPAGGGYVAFVEGPCKLAASRYWIATSGTLKIDEVTGTTVKFSFAGLAMNQDAAEQSESQGTFTMDGSGTAELKSEL
jgi:hypothetical protein